MKRRLCGRCGRQRAETFFTSARGRICVTCQRNGRRRGQRAKRVFETYDITLEEYELLHKLQGGVCAICKGTRKGNFDIDHDHKLEKASGSTRVSVRGLLCKRCNRRLLPACLDDPEILRRAVEYLVEPPARQVIR